MTDETSIDGEAAIDRAPPGLLRRFWRSVLRLTVVLASVLWLVGTGLWLTVRDRLPVLAPVSYGLPLPILVACGFWVVAFLRRDWRRLRLGWLVLVVMQTGWWLSQAVVYRAEAVPEKAATLLFWNVCRGYRGYEEIGAEINSFDADVVALVEATNAGQDESLWRRICPDYEVKRLGSGMILLLRGERLHWEFGAVPGECRYQILDLKIKEQTVTLIVIDVRSDPRISKEPAFDRIEELISRYSDRPFIIAGDFNTPLESIYIQQMRQRMQNAFETRGSGFRETWPIVLPVLSLDQIWGNDRVQWHRCEHGWSSRSDHRPVLAAFSTKP